MITLLTLTLMTAPPAPTNQVLIEQLPACEELARCEASKGLIERGRGATSDLLKALDDPRELVRFWTCGILSETRDERAFDKLQTLAASDPKLRVKTAALFALGALGDQRATPTLIAALGHKDVNLRIAAALALASLRDPTSVNALIKALRDKDEEVRMFSMEALGALRARAALPALILRLKEDLKPEVRAFACIALARIGAPSAASTMMDVVERDPNLQLRAECAAALGRLGNAEIRPRLKALKAAPEPLKSAVEAALQALSSPKRPR